MGGAGAPRPEPAYLAHRRISVVLLGVLGQEGLNFFAISRVLFLGDDEERHVVLGELEVIGLAPFPLPLKEIGLVAVLPRGIDERGNSPNRMARVLFFRAHRYLLQCGRHVVVLVRVHKRIGSALETAEGMYPRAPNPAPSSRTDAAPASLRRHVLPKDWEGVTRRYATAKHKLVRNLEPPDKRRIEAGAVRLTPGKLNAVRAAFKGGVKASQIARQFGLSQSDVRKVLASYASRRGPWPVTSG
jgi:hypothetical protein